MDATAKVPDKRQEPVTVVVRRLIKPGQEAEFENWLKVLSETAGESAGYLGMDVMRPQASAKPEYDLIFRFASQADFDRFDRSPERRELLRQLEPMLEADLGRRKLAGLDYWFEAQGESAGVPKYKMVLVTFVGAYPVALIINVVLRALFPHAPLPGLLAGTLVITMTLMTYVVMPWLTRVLGRWLHD
jgi:antibiotic biosynthesis monooxygenase (ABM) superfamily enzyme